jgi:signal transduction histidine kinase
VTDAWGLFPYPTIREGRVQPGSLVSVPGICEHCISWDCASSEQGKIGEQKQCRFGMTYARVDDSRVTFGIVATDLPMATKRTRKVARQLPRNRVRTAEVERAINAARALGPRVVDDFELAQDQVLRELREHPDMHEALAVKLRKDFDANLDQSHDFLQLVKLVRGHAEALLLTEHPGEDVIKAAETEPALGAIYFSTELMLLKMDSLVFLREINRALGGRTTFQIHPYLLKYVRIYDWQARQKNVRLRVQGTSYGRVTLNSDAVGAVIQGLLDNLVKYAPAGSDAWIDFAETDSEVGVDFVGLGPRIEPEEVEKIFLPGFRATAARKMEQSGLGVGLATAKEISDALGLHLHVHQDPAEDSKYLARYKTQFTVTLRRIA